MRTIVATLGIVVVMTCARGAFACSCTPHTVTDDVRKASSVTLARVLSAREVPPSKSDSLDHGFIATVEVIEVLKGNEQPKRRDIFFWSLCGVDVVPSFEYVNFESIPGSTGRCSGTVRLTKEDVKADREYLQQVRDIILELASNPDNS